MLPVLSQILDSSNVPTSVSRRHHSAYHRAFLLWPLSQNREVLLGQGVFMFVAGHAIINGVYGFQTTHPSEHESHSSSSLSTSQK